MPKIETGAQVFDLAFHPSEQNVFLGLLTGELKSLRYDDEGQSEEVFSVRPSKRSCRGLELNEDGSKLYAVGKAKALYTVDTSTGKEIDTRAGIHDAPINRIRRLFPHMLTTGDDDGVVKLWDTRKEEAIRSYNHHFDFISDFMWLEDKKQVVATSGDGTLSVIDIRSPKTTPLAHSEDQEDELLSLVSIRNKEKFIVGTQLGILTVFDRSKGWGDCVDRIPGHPHSIDALCTLPSSYPSSHNTILTGSSDGLLRVVELFPTKLVGTIADHGEFPIERIAIDKGGEGNWVGSVGHDESLHLTSLKEVFEDETAEGEALEEKDSVGDAQSDDECDGSGEDSSHEIEEDEAGKSVSEDESSEEEKVEKKKRKRKVQDPLGADSKKKSKKDVDAEPSFFSGL